jgi:poly(3-hydroxybutyrate) depolymerase
MRRRTIIAMAIALGLGGADADTAGAADAPADAVAPLQPYASLDPESVTVSGISSGGFFAHQLHVAHSALVGGAAIMAGGPYGCAEQIPWFLGFNPMARVTVALGVCTHSARSVFDPFGMWLPEAPSAAQSIALTQTEHQAGRIDDPANLADDRAWLFIGDADGVVPLGTMQALEAYYAGFGLAVPALQLRRDERANHGVPIEEFTGTSEHALRQCGEYGPPFLIDCDFDAAERLLRHLYPQGFADLPAEPVRAQLIAFDQSAFLDAADPSVSMGATGFVYVPAACEDGAAAAGSCRLHVAFHGCQQSIELIGDDFYWDGGYNRWAEANRIVVLYPQATAWHRTLDPTGLTANPNGCWDWWGYSGPDYFRQDGKQIAAVRRMIGRLLGD